MNINPINFSFMGRTKDLGKVKAFEKYGLAGIKTRSCCGAVGSFNADKTQVTRDEFIMSCASIASNCAKKEAEENPNISFDDAFQEKMLALIEFAQESLNNKEDIAEKDVRGITNHKTDAIQFFDLTEDEPVDARDLTDLICVRDLQEKVKNALSDLTPREQYVIARRFDFDGEGGCTLEELAKELDVTREKIRQIEAKALRRLRHPSRSRDLREVLCSINDIDSSHPSFAPESNDDDVASILEDNLSSD